MIEPRLEFRSSEFKSSLSRFLLSLYHMAKWIITIFPIRNIRADSVRNEILDFEKKDQASFWVKPYSSVGSETASCLVVA